VLGEGLEASGLTAWAGRVLVGRAGRSRGGLVVTLMVLAALLAAVVTPNGAAAALLPVAVLAARRSGVLPAALLMPLAFAASAGALLLLSGSTVNVIVSDALAEETGRGFGFAEYASVGIPLVAVTVLTCVLAGPRLLPSRRPVDPPADLAGYGGRLAAHYGLDRGFYRLAVEADGPLVGLDEAEVRVPEGLALVGVQHADRAPGEQGGPSPSRTCWS
jgi:hypothetical protein